MSKCLLVGLGVSNLSAYKALKNRNYDVDVLVDEKYRVGDYNFVDDNVTLDDYEYIIKSPGISSLHRYSKLLDGRSNVINEIELAYILSNRKGKYIGITGSNGKTTSVCMLYHILNGVYPSIILAGNIGYPLCDYIDYIKDNTIVILELSSFQLETISKLKLHISSILSLCPNHLDSVPSLDYYYNSKFNITMNQDEKDYFIYDSRYSNYLKNNNVKCIDSSKLDFEFTTKLDGEFNRYNINIVYAICMLMGVDEFYIQKRIKEFTPLEYRMQNIGKIKGTSFINDAKSTTVDSSIACYNAYNGRKLLICGGKDKGIDFSAFDCIEDKCIYGELRKIVKGINMEFLSDLYPYIKYNYSNYDYIIFSPGTSSFDQYRSYKERGKEFNELFNRLKDEENKT